MTMTRFLRSIRSIICTTYDSAHIKDERNCQDNAKLCKQAPSHVANGRSQKATSSACAEKRVRQQRRKKEGAERTSGENPHCVPATQKGKTSAINYDSSTHLPPRLHLLLRFQFRASVEVAAQVWWRDRSQLCTFASLDLLFLFFSCYAGPCAIFLLPCSLLHA